MKKIKINKFLSVLLLLLVIVQASAQDRPNIIMIVLDDLNDYLGVMDGHQQAITPNLDKLAGEGILFVNAHSNAPVCAPSRASFMSGILPSTSVWLPVLSNDMDQPYLEWMDEWDIFLIL